MGLSKPTYAYLIIILAMTACDENPGSADVVDAGKETEQETEQENHEGKIWLPIPGGTFDMGRDD